MGKRLQSPDKHSVLIKGRSTSLTIEPDFWEQFRLIVMEHGITVGALLTEIERTMRLLPYQGPGRHRVRTLSAAVRVFVLQEVLARADNPIEHATGRTCRTAPPQLGAQRLRQLRAEQVAQQLGKPLGIIVPRLLPQQDGIDPAHPFKQLGMPLPISARRLPLPLVSAAGAHRR
jgi:predicted DNA-binding ribbon-helix-helix protein